MGFPKLFPMLIVPIVLFGFSEANNGQLHYFGQPKHLESVNLPTQPNQPEHFNYHGQFRQQSPPTGFEHLDYSNQYQRFSPLGQHERLGGFNGPQFRNAPEEHKQQYNGMLPNQDQPLQVKQLGNPNEPQLSNFIDSPSHSEQPIHPEHAKQPVHPDQKFSQQGHFEQLMNPNQPQLHNFIGSPSHSEQLIHLEHAKQPIHSDQKFSQQSHFEQFRNPNQPQLPNFIGSPSHFEQPIHTEHAKQPVHPDQKFSQQGNFEQFRNHNQPQLPNFIGSSSHSEQSIDPEHAKQPVHPDQSQQSHLEQLINPNQSQLHNFIGSHSEQFIHPEHAKQPVHPDQKFSQQVHFEQFRNHNQPQMHNTAPEPHQLNYHGMLGYSNEFQRPSYINQNQEIKQQGEIEKLANANPVQLRNASRDNQKLNYNGLQNSEILTYGLMNNIAHSELPYTLTHQNGYPVYPANLVNPDNPANLVNPVNPENLVNRVNPANYLYPNDKSPNLDDLMRSRNFGTFYEQNYRNPYEIRHPFNEPPQARHTREDRSSNYDGLQNSEILSDGLMNNLAHSEPPHALSHQNGYPVNPANLNHLHSNDKSHNLEDLIQSRNFGTFYEQNYRNPYAIHHPFYEPPQGRHPREDRTLNYNDTKILEARLNNSMTHAQMSNVHPQLNPGQTSDFQDLSIHGQSNYLKNMQQFRNYDNFWQHRQPHQIGPFNHFIDPYVRSYQSQTHLSNNYGYKIPSASDKNIADYFKLLQMQKHQQVYPHLDGTSSLNEKSSYAGYLHELNQRTNPWHFNQPHFQDNTRHLSFSPMHNYFDKAALPKYDGVSAVRIGSNATNSDLPQMANIHEHLKHPNKTEEASNLHLNENLNQQQDINNPNSFSNVNRSESAEAFQHLTQPHQSINTTDNKQLNISGNDDQSREKRKLDLLNPGMQSQSVPTNQTQQLNHSEILQQQDHSNHSEHLNATSLATNQSPLQQLLPLLGRLQQFNFSGQVNRRENAYELELFGNFTGHLPQNKSGESRHNVSQNQNQEMHPSGIHNQNNASFRTYSAANNLTKNQNEVKDFSHLNHSQQILLSNPFSQLVNQNKTQMNHNFTNYQQQNHSVSSNGSIPIGYLEPEKHQQLPDGSNQSNFRQQRQLMKRDNGSHQESIMHPSPPQQLDSFNNFQQFNQFQQPMMKPYGLVYFPGNQQHNYPVTYPEVCYIQKEHGPCQGALTRFYFDPTTGHCAPFIFGGCYGNANNFLTMRECELTCLIHTSAIPSPVSHPQPSDYNDLHYQYPDLPLWHPGPELVHQVCSLEKKQGPCRAVFTRYFYNPDTQNCEAFLYGGCYGNANNFLTIEECKFVCMSQK